MPIGKTFYGFPPRVVVDFSGALTAGSLVASSWRVRRTNQRPTLTGVVASGSQVTCSWTNVVPDPGADEVEYDGVAGDLRDAGGGVIGAFVV